MNFISLTEAITELAFDARMNADAVSASEIAEHEEWIARHIALKKEAERAAGALGKDVKFFHENPNALLRSISLPKEVADLFAAGVDRQAAINDRLKVIAKAQKELLDAARAGRIQMWGYLHGIGEPRQISLAELQQLVAYWNEERDCLYNRQAFHSWKSVIVVSPEAPSALEASLTQTTDKLVIRSCVRKVYRFAHEQAKAPPNLAEIVSPVKLLLEREGRRATGLLIKSVAEEAEFAQQRLGQGTPRPKHLGPANELKI